MRCWLWLCVVVYGGVCTLLVTVSARPSPPISKIKVHPTGNWFLDEDNRVRLFHGVNSVMKSFPWYYSYLLNATRLDDFREFGLNVVRLGTMWSGVEPAQGVINETYIDILRTIIQGLSDRGVYVILDMHQDVMSSLYNSYDGVPLWLMEQFPPPTNPYPWPLETIEFWEQGYTTQACSEGFQHFYNNTNNAIEAWAEFWALIAQRLGAMPSVLGYNYMNEPWIGDYFSQNSLLLPGVAGQLNLLPNYDVVNEYIRRYDTASIQFYEPVFYGQLFHGGLAGSGFDRVPGGDDYRNVSAFSYHTYCWWLEFIPSNATDEEREEAILQCENGLLPSMFQSAVDNAKLTGGTSILTEFGLCKTGNGSHVNIECRSYLELADRYLQSWVDWDYSDGTWYSPEGHRNMEKITVYVRPYAQAIAGAPLEMSFNSTTHLFTLLYIPDWTVTADTEIFVPALRYPDGFSVTVVPDTFQWSMDADMLHVFYVGSEVERPDIVEVYIASSS